MLDLGREDLPSAIVNVAGRRQIVFPGPPGLQHVGVTDHFRRFAPRGTQTVRIGAPAAERGFEEAPMLLIKLEITEARVARIEVVQELRIERLNEQDSW